MVSAKENPVIDDLIRPQPIKVEPPPKCFEDGKTFRPTRMDCILCDHFVQCRKAKRIL